MARLKYISSDLQLRIENKLDRISGLLNGLINSLK
jgi:hypothetical protein